MGFIYNFWSLQPVIFHGNAQVFGQNLRHPLPNISTGLVLRHGYPQPNDLGTLMLQYHAIYRPASAFRPQDWLGI